MTVLQEENFASLNEAELYMRQNSLFPIGSCAIGEHCRLYATAGNKHWWILHYKGEKPNET
jgi:hypothetical protein